MLNGYYARGKLRRRQVGPIDVRRGDKDLTHTLKDTTLVTTLVIFSLLVATKSSPRWLLGKPLPVFDIRMIVMRGDVMSWSIMANMSEKGNPGCLELAVVYLYTSEKLVTRRKNAGN